MEAVQRVSVPQSSGKLRIASVGGAVVSAFLASLCCLGPLVFALLSIGGAGLLVKFEPYRPYFTVLTVGLLGLGFYFTYRKPRATTAVAVEGGPACDCEHPKTNRFGRIVLWVATVLVVGFLGFPYIAAYLFE